MECLLHRDTSKSNGEVVPFTEYTYAKAQECCKAWKKTMAEQDIAIANAFECAVLEQVEYYGYHINCYNQFTKKSRIVKARVEARQAMAKRLRPPSAVVAYKEVLEDAFPRKCMFCHVVGKTPLIRCRRTETSAKILAAAVERKEQCILDQIVGEDLVARQLVYHLNCYSNFISVTNQASKTNYPVLEEAAFRDFVAGVTTEVREGRSCVPMTALADLFVKTVMDDGKDGGLREKFAQHTAKIKKHCPYRMFKRGKLGNGPETGVVPWKFGSLDSAACGESSATVEEESSGACKHIDGYSKCAQQFALLIHEKMRNIPRGQGPVPPELPNFLAWCTSEKGGSSYGATRMPRERRDRIMTIAQDIVDLTAEHSMRWK